MVQCLSAPNRTSSRFEDPPEDFAIGNVCTPVGDRLVFNGEWSGPDQILQDVLDAVETGPASLDGLTQRQGARCWLCPICSQNDMAIPVDTAGSIDLIEVQIPPTDIASYGNSACFLTFRRISTCTRRALNQRTIEPFTLTLEELRAEARTSQNQTTTEAARSFAWASIRMLIFPTSSAYGDCMVRPEEDRKCRRCWVHSITCFARGSWTRHFRRSNP
jgi:hypothetical protein